MGGGGGGGGGAGPDNVFKVNNVFHGFTEGRTNLPRGGPVVPVLLRKHIATCGFPGGGGGGGMVKPCDVILKSKSLHVFGRPFDFFMTSTIP